VLKSAAMLTSTLLVLSLGTSFSAQADEGGTRVFVAPFNARSRDAESIAAMMPGFLRQQLDSHAELDGITVDEVGPVADTAADVYLGSCPPGEEVGCAFVVGEVAHAELAVTGTVDTIHSASRVEVHIIDVLESREVVSFQADLAVGDDAVFAEGVAKVLVAIVKGEAGRSSDIRDEDDYQAQDLVQQGRDAKIASQLDQLSQELGDVTTLSTRREMQIQRPRVTVADLSEKMEQEGIKPWERLDMGPREYLRYKNSRMSLGDWRDRSAGRQGQVIIRAGLAIGTGPSHGDYYGVYARSDQDLSVVEAYSYQAVESGSGFGVAGSVSYGLLPFLEVGVHAGTATGRYGILIDSYVVGDQHTLSDPEDRSNLALSFGPQVLGSLMPTSPVRPVVGVEATYTLGTVVTSRYALPENSQLDAFSRPGLFSIGGRVGVEATISKQIDLFLHLPFGAVVAGRASDNTHIGSGGLDPGDVANPPSLNPISAGATAGIQVRLGGHKSSGNDVMDSDMM